MEGWLGGKIFRRNGIDVIVVETNGIIRSL